MAKRLKIRRQDVRRAMRAAQELLVAADDMRRQALGAYTLSLLNASSSTHQGLTVRKMKKQADMYLVDGPILGEFEIRVGDPTFEKYCFDGRAIRQ